MAIRTQFGHTINYFLNSLLSTFQMPFSVYVQKMSEHCWYDGHCTRRPIVPINHCFTFISVGFYFFLLQDKQKLFEEMTNIRRNSALCSIQCNTCKKYEENTLSNGDIFFIKQWEMNRRIFYFAKECSCWTSCIICHCTRAAINWNCVN